ncbi:valine--tRNA ligase [Flaviflexus huanghaiensis]|uniref:valine--tRNA ligase n=1 Tax=Flaviflexus huanghaiensis TaxID=1111473 RepID=UPI0015F9C740|nr:valine--tRNA ligase [Flaviflexus huanghaiensis]
MTENASIVAAVNAPDRVSLDGLETKWGAAWEENGTYTYEPTSRDNTYSIDTPPPTVSGSLHVGHVFSYTHTDIIARYKRMTGKHVFYPMGWDDNGLPTERRVQNYYGVRCDPSLPYDVDFVPPHDGGDGKSIKYADQKPISRRNFIELCWQLTAEDEEQFEHLWRTLGLSVDWKQNYQTIGPKAQKVAQAAFLRNLARGEAYQAQAPGLWDVTFQTAVAQAELEAREYPGAYHKIAFHGTDEDVVIETTRPELLPACVALIAHPDDERYQHLFGTTVTSPVFGVELPVLAHSAAEKDKGAGIAMCCTFGDLTDVQWWRELSLPLRPVLGKDGRILPETPEWITAPEGVSLYEEMAGKTIFSSRKAVVDKMAETGDLIGEPVNTQRMTNFFEKGDKPLEIVTSRQWYIRNGGRPYTEANGKQLQENLLEAGKELEFYPDFMRVRYENWTRGLNTDWLISRQRFFGVPLPVWYEVNENGEPDYSRVITPTEAELPVDPSSDVPAGFTEDQRGVAGGFVGEVDIMDTWATSSMSPQIATGWLTDETLFNATYPMDLRPQGQDIIRTWLFSSMVRAHLEFGGLPWKSAAISGWILDPDRKKMSKSKGNVVTPMGLLEKHSSDGVRYWAASARLGTDAAFEENQMKIGRRLAIKLLNASKFALTMGGDTVEFNPAKINLDIDRAMVATVARVVTEATDAFEAYDHTRALEVTESAFWSFCDDYLELVKDRAYNRDGLFTTQQSESARAALALSVDAFVRLLAPVLPYAAEEVWSWYAQGSVHRASWPVADDLSKAAANADESLLAVAGEALAALRRVKSENKVSQRTTYASVAMIAPDDHHEQINAVLPDLRQAAHVRGTLDIVAGDSIAIAQYELDPAPAKN